MFPMCVSSAWPVMVLDPLPQHVQSNKTTYCFVADTVSKFDVPLLVFCKLKHRRKRKAKNETILPQTLNLDTTLNYSFLNDVKTRSLIKRSKVLFIMRGLPGSGKSTVVKAITQSYPASIVCSADDYFLQDGVYNFDAACLSSAHETCQNKARDGCNAGVPVVIVDNTNVRRWEMKFYLELASHRDYVVVPVQPKTAWMWNPVELAARNKHGVDINTLKRKVNQFDDVIPVYYAWFLNASASKQLKFIAQSLLKECVQRFPAFSDRLLKQLHVSPSEYQQWLQHSTAVTDAFLGLFEEYYTRGNRAGCVVHCTAKFCAGGRAVGAKCYHAQPLVQNSLGKAFMLEISSVCFSPRTVGARVKLGDTHLLLFDKPEEKDWNGKQQHSSPVKSANGNGTRADHEETDRSPGARGGSPGHSKRTRGGKRKGTKSKDEIDSATTTPPTSNLTTGLAPTDTKPVAKLRARSAHITIGCAQGFESRETNFDVLRLCDMEASCTATDADFVPVTGGRARYFGDGVCCVYFDPPLHVNTIYSGFY